MRVGMTVGRIWQLGEVVVSVRRRQYREQSAVQAVILTTSIESALQLVGTGV